MRITSTNTTPIRLVILGIGLACLMTTPAAAYMGPGAGLTAIGTVLAVIAALLLAIVGFVWYPLKRLLGIGSKKKKVAANAAPAASPKD